MTAKPTLPDWRSLPGNRLPSPDVLAETLDGGQSFRWQQGDGLGRTGPAASPNSASKTAPSNGGRPRRCAPPSPPTCPVISGSIATGPRSPIHSRGAAMRISHNVSRPFLACASWRQPSGETLLGFLCSATKQIVQIKQMCALLAERHGLPLVDCRSGFTPQSKAVESRDKPAPTVFRQLPTGPSSPPYPKRICARACLAFVPEHPRHRPVHRRPPRLAGGNRAPALRRGQGASVGAAGCRREGRRLRPAFRRGQIGGLSRRHVGAQVPRPPLWSDRLEPAPAAHFGRTHFGPLAGLAPATSFAWERRHGAAEV